MDLVDSCRKCTVDVSDMLFLQSSVIYEKWLHVKCSNLTDSQFAALSSSSTPCFCHMWITDSFPVNLDLRASGVVRDSG